MKALTDAEKLEFVSKSASWIQGKDIMDSCFILNFGYEASLPWPQVHLSLYRDFIKQLQVRLDNNDTEKSLQLVPETYGMDVPSACTIVMIAGQ